MSKGNGWVPLDKGLVKTLSNIDRQFSYIEAMFSYTIDADNGVEGSINGYAKLWQWSRGKVRRFVNSMRTGSGHIADRKGTGSGHPIHFVDKGLWSVADRKRTGSGQEADRKEDTTIYPNPNPNKNNNHFEQFWKHYPKKKNKGQAEKAWSKIKPSIILLEEMIVAISKAKETNDWQKEEGQYIPYPSSWLNAKGWKDEVIIPGEFD